MINGALTVMPLQQTNERILKASATVGTRVLGKLEVMRYSSQMEEYWKLQLQLPNIILVLNGRGAGRPS
jgi:hypothetical protein